MNRGRCIKLGSTPERIINLIKKFNTGIYLNHDQEDDENNEIDEEVVQQQNPNQSPKNISSGKSQEKLYSSSMVLVQKYLEKPLLYYGRKFDIRLWVLMTHKYQVWLFK